MGAENVLETEMRMGAEDFGYYTQVIPGCFYRIGVRNEAAGIVHNVHTPKFDIDERAIETGMGMMIDKKGIEEVMRIAIDGMLPRNKLRKDRMKRLTITV